MLKDAKPRDTALSRIERDPTDMDFVLGILPHIGKPSWSTEHLSEGSSPVGASTIAVNVGEADRVRMERILYDARLMARISYPGLIGNIVSR